MVGAGDWVVCVDDAPLTDGTPVPLFKGEFYQIEAVWGDLPHGDGTFGLGDMWMDVGVDLVGVPPPKPQMAYGLHRFRPLDPTAGMQKALAAVA